MKNLKKALVGLAIVATVAVTGMFAATPAKAQYYGYGDVNGLGYGYGYGAYNNPISQWIVLSGLFAPTAVGGTTGDGVTGGAYNNPISQWIVLSGLFAPYGMY